MGHGVVVCGYKLTDMTADDLAYDWGFSTCFGGCSANYA